MFREDILQAKIRQPYQVHSVDTLCEVVRKSTLLWVFETSANYDEFNCKTCWKRIGKDDRFFITRLFHSDCYHHECFLKDHPFVSIPDFADFHKLKYSDQQFFRDKIIDNSSESLIRLFPNPETSSDVGECSTNERLTTRKRSHSETEDSETRMATALTQTEDETKDPIYHVMNKFKILSQLETRDERIVVDEKIDTLTRNGQELPKNWMYINGGMRPVSFNLDYAIAECIVYGVNRKCPDCNKNEQRKGQGILLFAVDKYICCGYRQSMYDCNYESFDLERKVIKLDPNIYHISPFHNMCEMFAKLNQFRKRYVNTDNPYVVKLVSKLAGETYASNYPDNHRRIVKEKSEIITEVRMSDENKTEIIYKADLVKDLIQATGKIPFVRLEARKMNDVPLYCLLQEWGFKAYLKEENTGGRVTYFNTETDAILQFEWAFEFETGNDFRKIKGNNMEEAFVKMWSMFYPSFLTKSNNESQEYKVNRLLLFILKGQRIEPQHLSLLSAQVEHIDYRCRYFKIIQKYLQNGMQTRLSYNSNYSIEIMDVFRVNTPRFPKKYQPLLLWHGTKVENVSGILNKGFIIDPNGGKDYYGPGVYLCDVPPDAIEAMNRWTAPMEPYEAILLLCEVATKDFVEMEVNRRDAKASVYQRAINMRDPQFKRTGLIVKGNWGPNYAETMDEGRLPRGKPVRIGVFRDTQMQRKFDYTTYVAFYSEVVRVKFLVCAKFKRNSNWMY